MFRSSGRAESVRCSVLPTADAGQQGCDMNKWYHPFGLLILSAMVSQLTGCTMTKDFFAKRSIKIPGSTQVASAYTKTKESLSGLTSSSSKKVAKKDSPKKSAIAKAGKSKVGDEKDSKDSVEQVAASDKGKKKSRSGTEVAKNDAGATTKAKAKVAKSKKPVTGADDELDSFVSKIEPATATRKEPADHDEFDPFEEQSSIKKVVQVKKDEGNDLLKKATAKSINSIDVEADPFEEDLETPFAESKETKGEAKVAKKSESFDEDLLEAPEVAAASETAEPSEEATAKSPFDESDMLEPIESVAKSALDLCPDAKGELNGVLKSIDPAESESLKKGLHRIGQLEEQGKAALPLLKSALKNDDPFVRIHSALALVRQGASDGDTVQVVTESLKSRDPSLRSFGMTVLEEMGPEANDVLKSLSKSLNDPDPQVRIRSAEVLIQYEDYSMPALQKLLACLKDRDENVRWLSAYSLAELAPESPEAVQALMKAVSDPVGKVRVGAAFALGEIGPYAKRSVPELRKVLGSTDDEELKNVVSDSLKHIESPAS